MNRRKRFIIITKVFFMLSVLMLLWNGNNTANAADPTGEIRIQLTDLGTSVKDVKFQAYLVGDWHEKTGDFTLSDVFSSTGISFSDLQYASDWDEAAKKLSVHPSLSKQLRFTGKTNAEGELTFPDATFGIYLILPEGDNDYGVVSPFLMCLPYMEKGEWNLSVTAKPKAELASTSTEETTTETASTTTDVPDTATEATSGEESFDKNSSSTSTTINSKGTTTAIKTGDTTPIVLCIVLLLISGFGCIVLIERKHMENDIKKGDTHEK